MTKPSIARSFRENLEEVRDAAGIARGSRQWALLQRCAEIYEEMDGHLRALLSSVKNAAAAIAEIQKDFRIDPSPAPLALRTGRMPTKWEVVACIGAALAGFAFEVGLSHPHDSRHQTSTVDGARSSQTDTNHTDIDDRGVERAGR